MLRPFPPSWRTGRATAIGLVCATVLSACQMTASPAPSLPNTPSQYGATQAKGEWSLQTLVASHQLDLSQLRYRISLRVMEQEFGLAAPCLRYLGRYRSDATHLRFARIEYRDVACLNSSEAPLLKQLLQQTRSYRLQDDVMIWFDQNQHELARWQRIYL